MLATAINVEIEVVSALFLFAPSFLIDVEVVFAGVLQALCAVTAHVVMGGTPNLLAASILLELEQITALFLFASAIDMQIEILATGILFASPVNI